MTSIAKIVHNRSGMKALEKRLKEMQTTAAYVGIANDSEKNQRKDGEPITNSDLGFIHEFGSPVNGIPPRPFLVPGVMSRKAEIKAELKSAAELLIKGEEEQAYKILERTAFKSADAVRSYVLKNQGSFVPLSPSTISAREKKIAKVGGQAGKITILMDTNQLMRAVDGVVVKE